MPDKESPAGILAKAEMIGVDHLSPEKWRARVEGLKPEEVQREILRQATDAKLQLISILNALHFLLVAIFILIGVVLWKLW